MTNKEQNINILSNYQEDLYKIVGKNIKKGHALSVEEIVSEINNHILSKEKLISHNYESEVEFKKFLYGVARNWIKWTAQGAKPKDKQYKSKRFDGLFETDDGTKTAFEVICESQGSEDPFHEGLNLCNRYENLYKWIFDYSHFLTDHQKSVLPFVIMGKTLDEIGEILGVSHQAVSSLVLNAYERIKCNIKTDLKEDCDIEVMKKGQDSIKYLFGGERTKLRKK